MAPSSAASPDREMLDLYSTYGLYLAEEGRLIDNRLTSNLTIQGFLFAAYSFSLQKIVDVKVNLLNTAVVENALPNWKFRIRSTADAAGYARVGGHGNELSCFPQCIGGLFGHR